MSHFCRGFAFIIWVISSCLFQTEARPSQFITITASPAPATSEISFPPLGTAPAPAPAPAIAQISFPPVSAPTGDVTPTQALESETRENPYAAESRTENSLFYNSNFPARQYGKHIGYNVPERERMRDTMYYYDSGNKNSDVDNFNNDENGYSEEYYDAAERQRMSDTEFMEKGSERYENSKYEFDSMEEYEKQQQGYPENETWEDQP